MGTATLQADNKLAVLGAEGCGKATYAGMLYLLLAHGRLANLRFAGSESLRQLEEINSHLTRPHDKGGPSFPPHARSLHLGLRRTDDRTVDLFFPDTGDIWTTGKLPENLGYLADMNGYVVFLDATSLGMAALGKAQLLFESLLSLKKTTCLDEPVAVVLSKWDALGKSVSPDAFVRERLGGLAEWFEGHFAHYRTFGVSSVGAVTNGAPAPEPRDEGPLYLYRPRNVSEPLHWLLSEVNGGSP
jgi:hypothetical protein